MSFSDDPRRAAMPRPKDRVLSTETTGDREADDPEAAGQEGAAAGAVLGTIVGGPIGALAGAVIGGVAGSAGEAVDRPAAERRHDATVADHRQPERDYQGERPMTRDHTTDRSRSVTEGTPTAADDGRRTDHPDAEPRDPGAYVGREPERQAATIPGGVSRADERVAAHSSQPGPASGNSVPGGHREGPPADDDQVREAGQSR